MLVLNIYLLLDPLKQNNSELLHCVSAPRNSNKMETIIFWPLQKTVKNRSDVLETLQGVFFVSLSVISKKFVLGLHFFILLTCKKLNTLRTYL